MESSQESSLKERKKGSSKYERDYKLHKLSSKTSNEN